MKKIAALLNPQLESFIAIAKHKSVHAAARATHISQTAMTQRILNLEKRLQTTLFIRTPHGMQLTGEGERLLRYSHTVVNFSQETISELMYSGINTIQRVKISGPSSIMISRTIPNCAVLMKKFPQLYISFDVNDTNEVVDSLRAGESQFSIVEPEEVTRDMKSKRLLAEEYLLVCASHWKKRKLTDILQSERIIDFDESDQMTVSYLKKFDLFDDAQADRLFVNRTESLLTMLIEGYGYGVLTKEFSKMFLKNKQLIALNSGKTFDHNLCLAWYDRPEPPKYFQAIINAIS
jgi:DNA-binding transcriptional LysR family regulator